MQKRITRVVGIISTNCYIAYDDSTLDCAVIDPGQDAEGIWGVIRRENLFLKYIFLTHGHFDHIMALPGLRELSGAPVVIHKEDAGLLTDGRQSLAPPVLRKEYAPAEIQLDGGEAFDVGGLTFRWLHTPGHTRGSCCILCGDVLYTGDTLFRGECGRCGSEREFEVMLSSLKKLAGLPGDYAVCPGHGPESTMVREREHNPYILQALS